MWDSWSANRPLGGQRELGYCASISSITTRHRQFNHGALELGCGQMTEIVLEKGANTFRMKELRV